MPSLQKLAVTSYFFNNKLKLTFTKKYARAYYKFGMPISAKLCLEAQPLA